MNNVDSSRAVIIPPTIGAAVHCMISDPVPWPNMIGSRSARITATVIAFGRTCCTTPSRTGTRCIPPLSLMLRSVYMFAQLLLTAAPSFNFSYPVTPSPRHAIRFGFAFEADLLDLQ